MIRLRLHEAGADGPAPGRVLVVDDRRNRSGALPLGGVAGVSVIEGRGAGPAAARNRGWRRATAEGVAFLDDDAAPRRDWSREIVAPFARDEMVGCVGGACVAVFEPGAERPRPAT